MPCFLRRNYPDQVYGFCEFAISALRHSDKQLNYIQVNKKYNFFFSVNKIDIFYLFNLNTVQQKVILVNILKTAL